MKLIAYVVPYVDLQSYLDKFQDKIKFIVCYDSTRLVIVIDEA